MRGCYQGKCMLEGGWGAGAVMTMRRGPGSWHQPWECPRGRDWGLEVALCRWSRNQNCRSGGPFPHKCVWVSRGSPTYLDPAG